MAGRRRRENGDWFAHYVTPSNERVIRALRRRFGSDGYMFYYELLRVLTRSNGFRYRVESEIDKSLLAEEVGLADERFLEIWEFALTLEDEGGRRAFLVDDNLLGCPWLDDELAGLVRKREEMRGQYDAGKLAKEQHFCGKKPEEQKLLKLPISAAEIPVKENFGAGKVEDDNNSAAELTQSRGENSTAEERTVDRIFSPPGEAVGNKADANWVRWKSIKKSGLANKALALAYAMAPWDWSLKGDLDSDLPPADRLALVDVCADVANSLGSGAIKMVCAALRNLASDGWRVKQGHATPGWLLDVGNCGAQAVVRIRQFSAGGNGAAGVSGEEERFCGVAKDEVCECGLKRIKWARFKDGEKFGIAGSVKSGCTVCDAAVIPGGVLAGWTEWTKKGGQNGRAQAAEAPVNGAGSFEELAKGVASKLSMR